MNPHQTDAYKYLAQAQQARKAGDKRLARQYAEQAARLAPELEDVWLMMAALASPRASVVFMEQALQINPNSERVLKGMHWAVERLKKEPVQKSIIAYPAPAETPDAASKPGSPLGLPLLIVFLTIMCLGVLAFGVWSGVKAASALMDSQSQTTPAWAVANIPKATPANRAGQPSATAAPAETDLPTATDTLPAAATETTVVDILGTAETLIPINTDIPQPAEDTATPIPTKVPSATLTQGPSLTPLETDDPAYATPTALPTDTSPPPATQYVVPTPGPKGSGGTSGHWIDVDLTHQAVYAYDGNTLVNSFVVSTGTWQHPTVTGQYHVYIKYLFKDMTGPGYYLPNVPYTMFFYQGYAIHGTYWHSNFGTPMSHGCVNLSIPDSEWVYNWASVGTLVNVHY